MSAPTRWTQESALKLKYRPDLDPSGQGNHYVWEGGTGFGMRLYRTGRRTWVCGTTVTDKEAGKQVPRFFTVGLVGKMPLKDARIAAEGHLNTMRSGVDPRPAENARQEAEGLAATTFEQAMMFYVENRNCAPISKQCLEDTLRASGVPAIDLSRVHRAHIEPCPNNYFPERMAYVDAMDEDSARRRVAEVVAASELIRIEDAKERVSDCRRATDLIKDGVSEDRILRLFEVARDGDRASVFVDEPLFLVRRPAALILKWASIRRDGSGDAPGSVP